MHYASFCVSQQRRTAREYESESMNLRGGRAMGGVGEKNGRGNVILTSKTKIYFTIFKE